MTPVNNFFKSWVSAAIFPLVTEKKSLISKILAEAIAKMVKKGMNIMKGEDMGFRNAMISKANGTGT